MLDSYAHGAYGCRCGKWYMTLSGEFLTITFVRYELRQRAREYSYAIRSGEFESLAAAVKADAQQAVRDRAAANAKLAEQWETKRRNAYAQFIRAAREILLPPGTCCAYCGAEARTLDHVLPQARWPQLIQRLGNLAPACKPCNSQKNNRTPEEWKAARLAKGLPWPPPQPQPLAMVR